MSTFTVVRVQVDNIGWESWISYVEAKTAEEAVIHVEEKELDCFVVAVFSGWHELL